MKNTRKRESVVPSSIRSPVSVFITEVNFYNCKRSARPEIDIVAYNPKSNTLILVEVKSLLDSFGVSYKAVSGKDEKWSKRYKLFTNDTYRVIVTKRLIEEYFARGLVNKNCRVQYHLVAGSVYSNDQEKIKEYFSQKGWGFTPPDELRNFIFHLSERGYEDDSVTMAVKLLRPMLK